MSTDTKPIQVPPPAQIRERLATVVAEARALRRLLKLSEAAYRVQEVQNRTHWPTQEEGRHDA